MKIQVKRRNVVLKTFNNIEDADDFFWSLEDKRGVTYENDSFDTPLPIEYEEFINLFKAYGIEIQAGYNSSHAETFITIPLESENCCLHQENGKPFIKISFPTCEASVIMNDSLNNRHDELKALLADFNKEKLRLTMMAANLSYDAYVTGDYTIYQAANEMFMELRL